MANYYSILGIPENASQEDIRKAYRRMAKQFHPDVNNSSDAKAKFILVNKAYEVLIDPQQRVQYDQKIKAPKDPFYQYSRWVEEQKAKQEEEAKRKYRDFLQKKEKIKQSRLYYPYMVALYICTIILITLSMLVLVYCAYEVIFKSFFMFFFMLPFICVAAVILKVTLDEYKKYKAFFS